MKITFIYNAPHPVHKAWAESIKAKFVSDRAEGKLNLRNIKRFVKSFTTILKIPKDTDLLLCEGGSQFLTGALWKRRNKERKLVGIVSDPKLYYYKFMTKTKRRLYLWTLKKYDLLIPTSPMMESLIPKQVKAKIKVVFPFVDIKRHTAKVKERENNTIIFVGRIGKEKGADNTIKAFEIIKKRFPNTKLYMVGFGSLQKQLEERKINRVIFTGWANNPEEYIRKGTIIISLARIEPAGIAILEGMCAGLVPVVSKSVGNSYIVEKVGKELVVETPSQAAKTIINLFKDNKKRISYAKKAQKIVKTYTKEKSIEAFRKAIESMK